MYGFGFQIVSINGKEIWNVASYTGPGVVKLWVLGMVKKWGPRMVKESCKAFLTVLVCPRGLGLGSPVSCHSAQGREPAAFSRVLEASLQGHFHQTPFGAVWILSDTSSHCLAIPPGKRKAESLGKKEAAFGWNRSRHGTLLVIR